MTTSVINKVAGIADTTTVQRLNTVCCLGDSITAFNLTVGANEIQYNATGYFTWTNALLGSRLKLLNEVDGGGGVGNDTTTLMLARVQSDVIAFNPGWAMVLGGVNDVNSSTAAATIKSNLEAIYTTCMNAGINVVAITFWENTNAAWSDADRAIWLDVNQWIREYCRNNKGMFLVDGCKLVTESAAMPAAGATSTHKTGWTDGVHPYPVFARALGQEISEVITDYVPPLRDSVSSMMDRYDYDTDIKQLVGNPMMQETITEPDSIAAGTQPGGVYSGTVAAGFVVTNLAGTFTDVTCSLVTDPSPDAVGNAQRFVITNDGNAPASSVQLTWNPPLGPAGGSGRSAVGDTIYLEAYVKVSGTYTDFRGVEVRMFTGTPTVNVKIMPDNSNAWSQEGWEGLIRTPSVTLVTGNATVQPRIYFYFDGSSSDEVTIDISRVGVYKNKGD